VPIIINADDPRTIRAIQIAAEAGQWQACRTGQGEVAFRVPSQTQPGRRYLVTLTSCECPDFQRSESALDAPNDASACKHMLAVRLHAELVRAQQYLTRPRVEPRTRAHLRLVSND
jgi:hypothetical protein